MLEVFTLGIKKLKIKINFIGHSSVNLNYLFNEKLFLMFTSKILIFLDKDEKLKYFIRIIKNTRARLDFF